MLQDTHGTYIKTLQNIRFYVVVFFQISMSYFPQFALNFDRQVIIN